MMIADKVYRLLLRAYPAELREEYGREMLLTFRDARRDRVVSEPQFWLDIIRDIARTSAAHAAVNTIAVIAALSGGVLGASAIVETVAGGGLNRDGVSLVVLGAIVVAAVLLLRCGVALWRRRDDSSTIVRRAATACLVIVGVVAVYRPILSVFGRLLGLTIPLVLLALTRRPRGTRRTI